jgi:ribosomal protein L3
VPPELPHIFSRKHITLAITIYETPTLQVKTVRLQNTSICEAAIHVNIRGRPDTIEQFVFLKKMR